MQQVSPQQVPDDALLIDVREPHEYASVHAEGATNLPLSQMEQWVDDLERNENVYVICRSGGRSAQAIAYLENAMGFNNLIDVAGGTIEWVETGQPKIGEGDPYDH